MNYIRTPEALAEAIAALSREPLVAADTEAASFHRYRDRIFLIQLSSPSRTEIIDPLAVADLSPVGRLLADPKVEKIFHDADYDLRISIATTDSGRGGCSTRASPPSCPASRRSASRHCWKSMPA